MIIKMSHCWAVHLGSQRQADEPIGHYPNLADAHATAALTEAAAILGGEDDTTVTLLDAGPCWMVRCDADKCTTTLQDPDGNWTLHFDTADQARLTALSDGWQVETEPAAGAWCSNHPQTEPENTAPEIPGQLPFWGWGES